MSIRVLLAEDQAMVRGALAALLSLEEDIEIVAEASRGDEVISAALDASPDVALLARDGERRSRFPAQGRPGLRTRDGYPPGYERRAGG